jgi:hypothetical protein
MLLIQTFDGEVAIGIILELIFWCDSNVFISMIYKKVSKFIKLRI